MNDYDANKKKKSCGLIFGVFNNLSEMKVNDKEDDSSIEYKFVLFENMIKLENQSPLSNTVQKDQFQYYIIESTCDNCTLMISVQKFSSGDPDLYINYGDLKLPSKNSYDF
jgi:hypothetical protein